MKTGGQFSEGRLIESLRKANVDLLEMNKYKGVYYDEVLKCIDDAMGTTLGRRYWNLQDIKNLIAGTKQEA